MRKRDIQSADNGVGQTQKQGNTAANRRAAKVRLFIFPGNRKGPAVYLSVIWLTNHFPFTFFSLIFAVLLLKTS